MCDYSLHGLPNRLAQEGEDLVAHRFPTGAIGLTSPAELCRAADCTRSQKKSFWSLIKAAIIPPGMSEIPAVCVPPGACTLRGDCARLSKIAATAAAHDPVPDDCVSPTPRS